MITCVRVRHCHAFYQKSRC